MGICIIMVMPNHTGKILNKSLQKQQKKPSRRTFNESHHSCSFCTIDSSLFINYYRGIYQVLYVKQTFGFVALHQNGMHRKKTCDEILSSKTW